MTMQLSQIFHTSADGQKAMWGGWQAKDGHAVSDPKTFYLHLWHPANLTHGNMKEKKN